MRKLLAMGLAIIVVAAACQSTSTPNASGTAGAGGSGSSANAAKGGRLIQGVATEITSLQPLLSADDSEIVWSNFYPRILQNNPDTGELGPGLAQSYDISSDGLTITFHMRPNVKWSDGVAFDGNDYKYTVEATVRAKKPIRKPSFNRIVGFQDYVDGKTDSMAGLTVSSDGLTVTVKLGSTLCTVARALASAGGGVLPMHSFMKYFNNKSTDITQTIDTAPLNDAPPASVGPWVFKDWQKGVSVTMTRNDNYWKGAPLLEEYVVKLYSNAAAVKAALLTGEITIAPVEPTDVAEVTAGSQGKLAINKQKIATNYNYIGWNEKAPKAPWLAVPEVRQALWYGLDVKTIIAKVILGNGSQMYTHVPQESWAYPASGISTYDYNVATAKSLLEKAGAKMGGDGIYRWTDGSVMQMRLESTQQGAPVMSVAQEQYKAIGIKIDTITESAQALFERNDPTNFDHEGTLTGNSVSPDPDGAYIFFNANQQGKAQFNWFHYVNADVTAKLESGRFGPDCSQATRKTLYQAVNKQINNDAVYTWLYSPVSIMFASTKLHNFGQKPYGISTSGESWDWNSEKLWLDK